MLSQEIHYDVYYIRPNKAIFSIVQITMLYEQHYIQTGHAKIFSFSLDSHNSKALKILQVLQNLFHELWS